MCRTVPEALVHEPPIAKPTPDSPTSKRKKRNLIWAGVAVASLLITSTIIVVAVGLDIQQKQSETTENPTPLPLGSSQHRNESKVRIISRNEWKSLPANGQIAEFTKPVKYVVVCHTTGRFCETFANCSFVVRWIQHHSINTLKKPDTSYNFLIGGDGNVYEARGWNKVNDNLKNSISISIIGNYVYDHFTEPIINATQEFLKLGIEKGYIDPHYILVPHNQTMNTMSPGKNAYNVIKTWPHYSPEIIF